MDSAAFTAAAQPERLAALLRAARHQYTPLGLLVADARSKSWSRHLDSPYRRAVDQVAQTIQTPGAYLLNYSYEWGCTAGAIPDPALGGTTLLRTLDWPFDGLGQALILLQHEGAAGPYASVTWPGYAGVLTASAPGRFAAAINQPPLPLPGWGRPAGWLAQRLRVGRSHAMPPAHLLRLAFDTCPTFAAAVALIRTTPVCIPAIFTLAGPNPDEAVVVERTQTDAHEPTAPFAANHWAAASSPPGRPRHPSSPARRTAMTQLAPDWSLSWLRPPILQPDTRVVVMANPATGRLLVQGWERAGPATSILEL